jgi:hypothetical protein
MTRTRFTVTEVRAELRAHGVEPAFDTYANPSQPLAFLCFCPEGRPGTITFRALHYQNVRPLCPDCRRGAQQARMRANRRDQKSPTPPGKTDTDVGNHNALQRADIAARIVALFVEHGARPLDPYVNQSTPMRFVCGGPCGGNIQQITPVALRSGRLPRCRSCQAAARRRGPDHHRYNPDLTDADRARPRTAADRRWENAVRQAHNDTCVISNRRGTAPHHLYDHSSHPELRLVLQNGVCLTRKLHREFHDAFGYGGNTHAQFLTFYETLTGSACLIPDPLSLDPGLREFVT